MAKENKESDNFDFSEDINDETDRDTNIIKKED